MSDGNVIDWRNAKRRSHKAKARATKTPTSPATVALIGGSESGGEKPASRKPASKGPGKKGPGSKELGSRAPGDSKGTGETSPKKKPKASNQEKAARRRRARGLTLCRAGRHRWAVDNSLPFDVAGGKLVTRRRCRHCGKTRVDLD